MHALLREPKSSSAGCQNDEPVDLAQQFRHEHSCALDDVLAVVENEYGGGHPESLDDGPDKIAGRRLDTEFDRHSAR